MAQEGTECYICGGNLHFNGKHWTCNSCAAERDADAHRDRDIIRDNQNKNKHFKPERND